MDHQQIYYVEAPRKGEKIRWIAVFLAIAILSVALIVTVVRMDQQQMREVVTSSYYGIGTIDAEDGLPTKNTGSIYTKTAIPVDGLQMEFANDSKVTVQIFFYNKYNMIIEATEEISANEDLPVEFPEDTVTVKLVLTPTNDAEVSWHEIADVAKQFNVSFAK